MAIGERSAEQQVGRLIETMSDVIIVGTAGSVEGALDEARRLEPDVVLVDADPPECVGLRIAARIGQNRGPDVIVVSGAERYAMSAFEVAALDYLLKPVRCDRLRRSLDRARARRAERDAHRAALRALNPSDDPWTVHVPDRHGGHEVFIDEIVSIRADKDYVLIRAIARTHIVRSTMKALAGRLPPMLVRVHRSAFVSTRHVRRWKASTKGMHALQMSDGSEVTVGPTYLAQVRDTLRSLGG